MIQLCPLEHFSVDGAYANRRDSLVAIGNPPLREVIAGSTEEFFLRPSTVYVGT